MLLLQVRWNRCQARFGSVVASSNMPHGLMKIHVFVKFWRSEN